MYLTNNISIAAALINVLYLLKTAIVSISMYNMSFNLKK